MQSQNKYIGDDKFTKLLEHYQCPAELPLIKLRFAGAVCSPNLDLRPTDVISSLWPQNQQPRLQTKEEAELFFKFFMGLWDEIFEQVKLNKIELPPFKIKNEQEKCPSYIAQILDSLADLAALYGQLSTRNLKNSEFDNLVKTVNHTDKMVNRSIAFIIENYVLPRFEKIQSKTN